MKLEIKGTIISSNQKWIYDMLDMESTSPRDIILPE
ncbi:TPA: Clp protease ClpP, partial [Listeria monocytogenes]|nr:Clp protease ClpP [Listeria monocytogenes]